MNLLADGTFLAFFGAGSPFSVHCFDFLLGCEVIDSCFIHGYATAQEFCFVAFFFGRVSNSASILHTAFCCPNFQTICNVPHFLKCLLRLLTSLCGFSSPFLESSHLVVHCDAGLVVFAAGTASF